MSHEQSKPHDCPVNSYEVIINALPDLITAEDENSLRGAVFSAEYLQAHDGEDRETNNLIGSVSNVLHSKQIHDSIDRRYQSNPGSIIDRAVTSLSNRVIEPYARKRNAAEALFCLAEYKLVHGDWTSFNKASLDFSRALDVTGGPVRVRMMQRWLKPHFRRVCAEQSIGEISSARSIGALAAHQVYLENSLDPFDRLSIRMVYGKSLKKMRKNIRDDKTYNIQPNSNSIGASARVIKR